MTENNNHSTQLADARPQLDTPLRVTIPVNAPSRILVGSRDDFTHANAYSPAAQQVSSQFRDHIIKSYSNLNNNEAFDKEFMSTNLLSSTLINMDHDAQIKTAIRDFYVLALSSKRSGKKDEEATAYASLGVIYDNQSNYISAIENYKCYLAICEDINDAIGSACACNCIAVNYMLMASPPSDSGCLLGVKTTAEAKDFLNKALFYHTKHFEIGPDPGGKFVANTNVGLCLGMLGNINQSAKYHQDALRIAIKMQTLYGQSIAVGNLGLLALVKGGYITTKTCFEQVHSSTLNRYIYN
jgi:tetratricopeptide (TPR) repeat protein